MVECGIQRIFAVRLTRVTRGLHEYGVWPISGRIPVEVLVVHQLPDPMSGVRISGQVFLQKTFYRFRLIPIFYPRRKLRVKVVTGNELTRGCVIPNCIALPAGHRDRWPIPHPDTEHLRLTIGGLDQPIAKGASIF